MPAGSLSIRTKVVGSVALASCTFLLASFVLVEGPLRELNRTLVAEESAKSALRLADDLAHSPSGLGSAREVTARASAILARRVTIVADGGKVLADSARPPEQMENHADRKEIVDARASPRGVGIDTRRSATTGVDYLYAAARIDFEDHVLGFARVATPLREVDSVAVRLRSSILAAALLASLAAVPIGALAARLATRKLARMAKIADEIGHGELGRRIEVPGDDEVGTLGQAVNLLAGRLEEKLVRLTRDRALFIAVLDAIGEGLAFVDEDEKVLAANGAFRRLLGPGVVPEGQHLRKVLPDPGLDAAIRRALESRKETRAEAVLGEPPRDLRFRILPTAVTNVGTVALVLTEDLSPNPRVEALRVEAAGMLTRSLAATNTPLPREAQYALELSRAATLLDERPGPSEVVLLGDLVPRLRAADEAPAVYLLRSRAAAGVRMLQLELGLREEDAFPGTIEVEASRVGLSVELQATVRVADNVPRSSESLGVRLRALAHRVALSHFEAAGVEVEDQAKRLILWMPRA